MSVFLSHAWARDSQGRDTHERVRSLANCLRECGITVWFDEEQLKTGNLDAQMVRGIQQCQVFVVCLTKQYCAKINNAAFNPYLRDNCFKEWTCAQQTCKRIVPIVMESCMKNVDEWKGVVGMYLTNLFYLDASSDDWSETVSQLHRMLVPTVKVSRINRKKIPTMYII